MATRVDPRRGERLLLVAVAVGVIGMHHLLIACSSGPDSAQMTQPTASITGHAGNAAWAPPGLTPVAGSAQAGGSAVGALGSANTGPMCCDAMSGHPCMAVLTVAAALLVGLLMALIVAPTRHELGMRSRPPAMAARAPPRVLPHRVALCVWRC